MSKFKVILTALLLILIFTLPVFAEENSEHFGWISILPPALAIILAFVTKQVLISLFLGTFVGATMLNGWNPFHGFLRTLDNYLVGSLADSWNAAIIIFLLAIGGMIGVINKMGGTRAVAEALGKKINSPKSAQIYTYILGVFVFFDDYANTLIVGPTMRPITDKNRISKEKFSYIIDSTAAPVVGLALISTWVGYMIGVIRNVYQSLGIDANYYGVFIKTIPYSYYCIYALIFLLILILLEKDFGPMYEAEKRARTTGKLIADGAKPMAGDEIARMEVREDIELKPSNAIIPIITLIIISFIGLWYNGYTLLEEKVNPFTIEGIRTCFGEADSSIVLLWASMISGIVAIIMGVSQKIFTVEEAFDAWVDGAKSMVIASMILVLAWSLGSVTGDVGTAEFLVGIIPENFPYAILPLIVFIISGIISFATGTSWGTMAIVIPLAVPMIYAFVERGGDPHLMTVTLGTVLSGAIFGDHCSPISDTTIMSSMASEADHLDHVRTQIPYAITVATVAGISYILAGLLSINPIIILLIGIAILYGIIAILGKSVKEEDLKKGAV
ncbi:Na+/H+ antiporter NhaC family protein [Tepidimicrobium xylanilyticum]|uniref:Na+/H+ antiporter NhaC family protein n=1 Tax=Tepidimicrobium xylanilyticum TaxID=1123352 RepID=UPI00264A67D6|nr:Na+/H+ antiporter NhaC family protein [Tepidimicrobium xylanilyticum]GMG96104.1 sodium:proton antiporter [Tepidimicrobium xylanilyticum]